MQAKAHFPFFPPMGNVEIGVNQPCSILFHCSRGGTSGTSGTGGTSGTQKGRPGVGAPSVLLLSSLDFT